MKTHYTKDYIESITGMAFEDFLSVVKKYSESQDISFQALKNDIVIGDAVELALNEVLNQNEFYDNIEPAASEEEVEQKQGNKDATLESEPTPQALVEQIIKAQPEQVSDSQPSYEVYKTTNNVSFERATTDNETLSQKLDNVFQSNSVLGATDLSYNRPAEATTEQQATPLQIVVAAQNIEPNARVDIFFGAQNMPISGNLIADNGNGADTDIDGAVLNVVAGTFVTDQSGVVTLLQNGDFVYTPANAHSGVDTFSYTLIDSDGATDTAQVTFALSEGEASTTIDFSTAAITGYGRSQNVSNIHAVEDNGATILLEGNTWKDIDLSYTVTADTILEFDFRSTDRGEIHGIGFDTDENISSNYTFKLYGTQNWGITDFNNYADNEGEWVNYSINVGDYYTGNFNKLFFVLDNDANTNSNAFFRNITLLESGTEASETVTGTASSQTLYGNGGDDVLYGLDGDDVLYGGSGIDFLYGGNGADTFVFDDIPDIDYVQDFNSAEGDAIDLSDVLFGYDPLTEAINDFVQVTSNGTDTVIAVDTDGGGDNFTDIAVLHGVSSLPAENELEASGTIITV